MNVISQTDNNRKESNMILEVNEISTGPNRLSFIATNDNANDNAKGIVKSYGEFSFQALLCTVGNGQDDALYAWLKGMTFYQSDQDGEQSSLSLWKEKARKLFGENVFAWKFECPQCKYVQSVQQCLTAGMRMDQIAVHCVGGFIKMRRSNGVALHGCDYSPGELFDVNPIHIEGREQNVFRFAQ